MTSKPVILLLFISFFYVSHANTNPTWGKTGHRVVGAIAEQYLDKDTKKQINFLLGHQSLALTATYADEIKFDHSYDQFKPWHYLNMPLDSTYEAADKNPEGDLFTGINYCKQVLTDDKASQTDKTFYLKMLIHLIGDLHQPMHLGLKEDRGGNDLEVKWSNRDTNMHSVWDSKMIDSYDMSYSELSDNAFFLSKAEIEDLQKGDILDWIAETHKLTNDVYQNVKEGDHLKSEYSFKYLDVARLQMQKAGIRLAKVLNDIF